MKLYRYYLASVFLIFLIVGWASARVAADSHGDYQEGETDHEEVSFNRFSITLHGGGLVGLTDIRRYAFLPDSDELTFGGGISLNRHYSPALTMQTYLNYAEMKGISPGDDLSFETEMIEAVLRMRVSLNALLNPEGRSRQFMNVYAFIGGGALAYRSVASHDGQPVRFYGYEDDGRTKDDMKLEFVAPYGLGVNFRLSERIDLGIETGFRYTSSDRLDAWPVTGSRTDWYNFTSAGLTIRLGRNTNSADWASPRVSMYPGDTGRMAALEAQASELREGQEDLQSEQAELAARLDESRERVVVVQRSQETATARIMAQLEEMQRKSESMQEELNRLSAAMDTYFAVQVAALRENLPVDDVQEKLGITLELRMHEADGWYKYITGQFRHLEDAILQMQRIWGMGVKDAFVVEYAEGVYRPR